MVGKCCSCETGLVTCSRCCNLGVTKRKSCSITVCLCCCVSILVLAATALLAGRSLSLEKVRCQYLGKCTAPVCRSFYAEDVTAADIHRTRVHYFKYLEGFDAGIGTDFLGLGIGQYWANVVSLFTYGDASVCQYALTDSRTAEGFALPETTAYLTWADCNEKLLEQPTAIANGSLRRGRWDFGYFVVNDVLFTETPLDAFSLGTSSDKHEIIAPWLWKAYAGDTADGVTWDKKMIQQRIQTLLANKTSFGIQDLQAWSMQLLWELSTGVELSLSDANKFVSHQQKAFAFSLLPQDTADSLASLTSLKEQLRSGNEFWRERLLTDMALQEDNSTIKNLIADIALQSLLFAGGPLTPLYMNTGLAVMFAESSPLAAADRQLTQESVEQFAMEVLRKFPPVNAVPNRKLDGDQILYSIAMAQLDPDAWGSDAQSFKLRPMEQYNKYLPLSFAQQSNEVPERLQRGCPAMKLIETIGIVFFDAWRSMRDQWALEVPVTFLNAAPFASSVQLKRIG